MLPFFRRGKVGKRERKTGTKGKKKKPNPRIIKNGTSGHKGFDSQNFGKTGD